MQLFANEGVWKRPLLSLQRVVVNSIFPHVALGAATGASTTVEFGYSARRCCRQFFLHRAVCFGAWKPSPQQHLFRREAEMWRERLKVIETQPDLSVFET